MLTMASTWSYFNPTEVPDEVSRSARGCVDACMAFLGHPALEGAPWSDNILRGICPEGSVLRSLNNLGDIMSHLDNLYVAIMNKNGGIVGHAAVLYRSKDQMGTTKCHLYNPGGSGRSTSSILDLGRERDTARWNYICAVFIPGTDIPTKTPEVVDMQSDDDQDGGLSLRGSDGATASSLTSSSSSAPASQSQTASVIEYSPTRRQPSRATKSRPNNLFFIERLVPTAIEDYHRVYRYDSSSDQFPDQCTRQMIGQNVARYLLNTTKWVVWFRLSTSEYVIAKREAFRRYDIEEAELDKYRFIGYASLADWAFQEEIYEKSIQDADGKVFLDAVGLSDDPYKLFSTSRGRKRRIISDDGAQKKKKKQYAASGDPAVPEKDEEEQPASEAHQASADAKPAAARDSSDEASTKSSDSEYTGEEGSIHFSEGNVGASYDDQDEDEDDEDSTAKEGKEKQDEELSLYKEDEDNVSQEYEDEEGEEGETEEVNQAILSELKELKTEVANLKAELDAKNSELKAKDNELESANDENIRLKELAQAKDKMIEQIRKFLG